LGGPWLNIGGPFNERAPHLKYWGGLGPLGPDTRGP